MPNSANQQEIMLAKEKQQISRASARFIRPGNSAKAIIEINYEQTMKTSEHEHSFARTHHLTGIRNWCLRRISMHSLAGDHETAQALTNEHMELLKQVDSSRVLWITGKTIDR